MQLRGLDIAKWVIAFACLSTTLNAFSQTVEFDCALDQQTRSQTLTLPATLQISPLPGQAAIALLEESGSDIEWRLDGQVAFAPIDGRPLRQSRHAVALSAAQIWQIRAVSQLPAAATIRIFCAPDDEQAALPACLQRALALTIHPTIDAPNTERFPICAAHFEHAAAQAASSLENDELSLQRNRAAVLRWQALDDAGREAAAHLGIAQQLIKLKRPAEAIQAAQQATTLANAAKFPYLAARARLEGCLALRYAGRSAEALACLEPLVRDFTRLKEPNDAANAGFSLGAMLREDGNLARAQEVLTSARLALGPDAPLARGRLQQLAAGLASDAGRIDQAFAELNDAVSSFELAGNQRSKGNALLSLSYLYLALDSLEEAQLFAREAMRLFTEINALERIAAAQVALGVSLRGEQREAQARALFEQARATYRALRLGPAIERVGRLLDGGTKASAQTFQAWTLEQGEVAARKLSAGDLKAARLGVESASATIRSLAAGMSDPLLGAMALNNLATLRTSVVDAQPIGAPADALSADTWWSLLAATDVESNLAALWDRRATSKAEAESKARFTVSERMTHALLNDPGLAGDAALLAAHRAILKRLARLRSSEKTAAVLALPELAQLQKQLGDDAQLLWIASGIESGLLLSIQRDRLAVYPTAKPAELRKLKDALLAALSSPNSREQAIVLHAQALSAGLLPSSMPAPSKKVYVLAGRAMASVPYALLRWPGRQGWLIEHASVSQLLTLKERISSTHSLDAPRQITAFVAAMTEAQTNGKLAPLASAAREPELIAAQWPAAAIQTIQARDYSSSRLLSTLRTPNAWIHVAGHGAVPAKLNGFAGLWLPAQSPSSGPEFLSWMDLVAQPLQAELLVLNACSLGGTSATQSGGAHSFAAMLGRAGVAHVVAAAWPVSDASSGTWVSAFYRELAQTHSSDPALALRAAQLSLLQSRRFRHPFYWGGFVHFERALDANVQPDNPARK